MICLEYKLIKLDISDHILSRRSYVNVLLCMLFHMNCYALVIIFCNQVTDYIYVIFVMIYDIDD